MNAKKTNDITNPENEISRTWKTDWVIGVSDPSPAMTAEAYPMPRTTYVEAEKAALALHRETGRRVCIVHGKYLYAHAPTRVFHPGLHG